MYLANLKITSCPTSFDGSIGLTLVLSWPHNHFSLLSFSLILSTQIYLCSDQIELAQQVDYWYQLAALCTYSYDLTSVFLCSFGRLYSEICYHCYDHFEPQCYFSSCTSHHLQGRRDVGKQHLLMWTAAFRCFGHFNYITGSNMDFPNSYLAQAYINSGSTNFRC